MEPPGHEAGDTHVEHHIEHGHPPTESAPSEDASTSKSNLDHDIPIRLKALRMSLNLSAAMMDRHAGFSTGTTGRLERGDLRVYANHLFRICEATGISIGYFYDQVDTPGAAADTDGQELEKQRLLLAYMKIKNPALKRDVFELVETLAAESEGKSR